MKKFVIAGNRTEAMVWIKKDSEKRWNSGDTSVSLSDYVYVDSPLKIRGYSDPSGVFIGTWRERQDILLIVETLYVQCNYRNAALGQIIQDLRAKSIKPTPKLKPVAGGWINEELAVEHAANLLAKSIDQHIIDSIKKATP